MGVMSGLVARNHDDLEDLKRRGDRNYYEFNIKRAKNAQRVGPIQINLNKTDPKKSKYTMTLVADDRQIEKKDKTSGEPVQFYVGSSRSMPYEIVVFTVARTRSPATSRRQKTLLLQLPLLRRRRQPSRSRGFGHLESESRFPARHSQNAFS